MDEPRQQIPDDLQLLTLKERFAHFMSGFYAGVAAPFLVFRIFAPAQLHPVLNLMVGASFAMCVVMWKTRRYFQRRIADTAQKLLQSEQGDRNG